MPLERITVVALPPEELAPQPSSQTAPALVGAGAFSLYAQKVAAAVPQPVLWPYVRFSAPAAAPSDITFSLAYNDSMLIGINDEAHKDLSPDKVSEYNKHLTTHNIILSSN